jgi:chitin disaccharide deacetylase
VSTLVVTADDIGLHPGMTLGALEAHDHGIVTAVSVAANGRAFEHAVDLLKDRPKLDVGIHLTLVGERPLSPLDRIPSLLGTDGTLLPGFPAFVRRALRGGIEMAHVERELRAQIERTLGAGLKVVHANGHQHLHVWPGVFEIVVKLAAEYGISWVRIPNDPAARGFSPRIVQIRILNALGRRARTRLPADGSVRAVDRTLGIVDAGRLTSESLGWILKDVKGFTELICHPGVSERNLAAEYDWGYGWEGEVAALCQTEVAVRVGSFQEAGRMIPR